jgi:hypothetical protein
MESIKNEKILEILRKNKIVKYKMLVNVEFDNDKNEYYDIETINEKWFDTIENQNDIKVLYEEVGIEVLKNKKNNVVFVGIELLNPKREKCIILKVNK